MSPDEKRKIILINKKFQFRLIWKFLIVNFLVMAIFCGLLYVFLNSEIEANLFAAHVTYNNIKEMLLPIIITLAVINILISSIIITSFVLYASFRIAGPLYRFNEALVAMKNKNLKPMTSIRTGDQLYNCSLTLTEFSEIISDDIANIKNRVSQLKDLNKKENTKNEMTQKINELQDIIDQYES